MVYYPNISRHGGRVTRIRDHGRYASFRVLFLERALFVLLLFEAAFGSDTLSILPSDLPSDMPSDMPSLTPVNWANVPSGTNSAQPTADPTTSSGRRTITNIPQGVPIPSPSPVTSSPIYQGDPDEPFDPPSAAPSEVSENKQLTFPPNTNSLTPRPTIPAVNPTITPTKSPITSPTDRPTAFPTNVPTRTPSMSPTTICKHPAAVGDIENNQLCELSSDCCSGCCKHGFSGDGDVLPRGSGICVTATSSTSCQGPTPFPTQMPTISPTRNPTALPTRNPTKSPTSTPTQSPTMSPTSSPTVMPTKNPTNRPTASPTNSPSQAPTTGTPTTSPTPRPTPTGTFWPTQLPSISPSAEPTTTFEPSSLPSSLPSGVPSNPAPTISPTTQYPTSSPSNSPSLPQKSQLVHLVMSLAPWTKEDWMSIEEEMEWKSVTESHIRNRLSRAEVPWSDLQVGMTVEGQQVLADESSSQGQRRLRFLQSANPSLQMLVIRFYVLVSYRSSEDHEVKPHIFEAFETAMDLDEYMSALAARASGLGDISEVLVEIEGFEPPPASKGGSTNLNLAVIVGGAVGGAALVFLVVFFFLRRESGKEEEGIRGESTTTPETAQKIAVSTEILVEPQDDISTLGDPMFAPGGMLIGGLEKDEVTASVGDDYDYARQYRQGRNTPSIPERSDRDRLLSEEYTKASSSNSATLSKLNQMGESLFADDSSFEHQFAEPEDRFDVVAPAGKLGMVIDTPNGGVPVVHAIKDTSVLADRVRVGDRLISVDGEDCTAMTAMQVSKLISLKSEKPARVLVFVRTRANTPELP